MISIDTESRDFFRQKLTESQYVRVFFGGYG
jgi:hypothetical protein